MTTDQSTLVIAPEVAGEKPMKQLAPFSTLEQQARKMIADAEAIALLPPTPANAKVARTMRLEIRPLRTAVEKRHAELKRPILDAGNALDEGKNALLEILKPMEAKLLAIEQHAEREAERIQAEKHAARYEELRPFFPWIPLTVQVNGNFGVMPDAEFESLKAGAKDAQAGQIAREAKEKAEAEAKAKAEAERIEAQRVENERLALALDREHAIRRCTLATGVTRPPDLASLSADEFEALKAEMIRAHNAEADRQQAEVEKAAAEKAALEAAAQKERKEAAAKLKAQEDAAKAERDKAAAALKKQQDEAAAKAREAKEKADAEAKSIREEAAERERKIREQAEATAKVIAEKLQKQQQEIAERDAELAAKKAADAKAAADKLAAEKAAAAAPDKEKLMTLATKFRDILIPDLDITRTPLAHKLREQREKLAAWIEAQAEAL